MRRPIGDLRHSLTRWLDRRQFDTIAYLREEVRVLGEQLVRAGCSSPTPTGADWP
jgi:hypothetical protein